MSRISKILKELNISLLTLNQELTHLSLPTFELNSKVSNEDESFIIDYFKSAEIAEIDMLNQKIAHCRIELKKLFLNRGKSPEEMGELEKRQLFALINSKERNTTSKPKFQEYTEENFWNLYRWFESWNKKTEQEKTEEEFAEFESNWFDDNKKNNDCNSSNVIDEESAIMSALANGYGDAFGF